MTLAAAFLQNLAAAGFVALGVAITLEVRGRGGVARVAVLDTGLGIANENLATLFTRFGRVITPQTEHLKGTGHGLFLGRQLARLQGGDISVMSEVGKGSTFTLHLPTASLAEGSANGASADGALQSDEPVVDRRARTTRPSTD